MQLITLAEVLHLLNTTADPCTIVFSTADRQRRTGGELVTLEGCVKTGVDREAKATPQPPTMGALVTTTWLKRRPNHRANQTINLTILSSGKVRTVHVRLITEFNGQKVRW
ncbi:MAG: hypothetical protein EOO62_20410 [Hymenobacter sp.]|nr:MAG: hypothetical protein EOO62_20410 [Hymenobacter sp.]